MASFWRFSHPEKDEMKTFIILGLVVATLAHSDCWGGSCHKNPDGGCKECDCSCPLQPHPCVQAAAINETAVSTSVAEPLSFYNPDPTLFSDCPHIVQNVTGITFQRSGYMIFQAALQTDQSSITPGRLDISFYINGVPIPHAVNGWSSVVGFNIVPLTLSLYVDAGDELQVLVANVGLEISSVRVGGRTSWATIQLFPEPYCELV